MIQFDRVLTLAGDSSFQCEHGSQCQETKLEIICVLKKNQHCTVYLCFHQYSDSSVFSLLRFVTPELLSVGCLSRVLLILFSQEAWGTICVLLQPAKQDEEEMLCCMEFYINLHLLYHVWKKNI